MDTNASTATVKMPAANFTGDVWMNPVFSGDGTSRLTCVIVRFTPGARTNWQLGWSGIGVVHGR
jgi:quercetin dioxygenase-like cupin family protein